ncbi:MAG: reverse transcriptase family protein [Bacteroidota bacterium]
MYYHLEEFTPPKEKVTSWQLKRRAEKFIDAGTLPELAKLLGKNSSQLRHLVEHRHYGQYYVPKPKGGKRLIETPSRELKRTLKRLNNYLQAVYYHLKPECAYGCILATADEHKRKNIYTNALQHIKGKWLLSIDLEDFFHNISYIQIRQIFRHEPFHFNDTTVKLLGDLTTYENRLPIGSPTSPVLANLLCLPLDRRLTKLVEKYNLVYTRYLDDFSFSSKQKIKKKQTKRILREILESGFFPNQEKSFLSKITEETHITGLSLHTGKPDVSKDFLKHLRSDIVAFHKLTSKEMKMRNIFPAEILKSFRNSILGKLNFMKFIRGDGDAEYIGLKKELKLAL